MRLTLSREVKMTEQNTDQNNNNNDGQQTQETKPDLGPLASLTKEQQEALNSLISSKINDTKKKTEEAVAAQANASTEEKLAAIQKELEATKEAAVKTVLRAAVKNTHKPDRVVKEILDELPEDFDKSNVEALEEFASKFLQENAFYVKTENNETAGAGSAETPGSGGGSQSGAEYMSQAEMDAVTPEQLAADENLMRRYENSRNRLG